MSDIPKGAVAVIGMACRFPGARSADDFWRNLRDGVESIVSLSEETLLAAGVKPQQLRAPNYVKAAAVLDGIEMFDAEFFGFSPKEASIMDPQHRHFLECAWEALEHAGHDPFGFGGSIGVFAGCGMQAYFAQNLLPNRRLMDDTGLFLVRHTGNDKDFLSTRVSYLLNLRGPSISIQTACSTSLAAIHLAAQSLLAGECEMALAGGVTIELPHGQGYLYEEGGIVSRDGHCRAFDAGSTGTVFGSGVGVVVLRPLEDALAQGDTIHAVILGSAINNDGAGKIGYLAPSVEGQAAAVAEAIAAAGVPATTITFLETHGTGTQIGDAVEIKALTQAYRQSARSRGFCALGAVKTNIGHLDTAAGVAGFIKTVLALHHRQIPPTLHFSQTNPQIDLAATPFYINSRVCDWTPSSETPRRRAAVNSLGVGGTNAHVVLEEAPALPATSESQTEQLLIWSARSAKGAERQSYNFCKFVKEHPEMNLADAAFTLQLGRHAFPHRRVLAVADSRDAITTLEAGDPRRIFDGVADQAEPAVAFMFPGGGAQYPNMGREVYHRETVYRRAVDDSLNLLRQRWNIELRSLLFPEAGMETTAAASLEQPLNSILSMFITEHALARLWVSMGIQPTVMIGHSLGEYTAACLAGVMSLENTLAIVVARGRIFEKLPPGGMLSVGLSGEEVNPLLVPGTCLAAANAPKLTVVSGAADAIKELETRLISQDIQCQRLRISVAAHSEMLDSHLEDFRRAFQGIQLKSPAIPFMSNLTGEVAKAELVTTPDYWVRHLRQTVRFSAGLRAMQSLYPVCLQLEVGPGTTLSTLAQQHLTGGRDSVVIPSMRHPSDSGSDVLCLLSALGRLWAAGLAVDWGIIHRNQTRRRVPLPAYPFEHKKYWIEPQGDLTVSAPPPLPEGMTRRGQAEQWLAQITWAVSPYNAPGSRIEADTFVLFAGGDDVDDDFPAELAEALRVGNGAPVSMASLKVISVRRGSSFSMASQNQWIAEFNSDSELAEVLDHAFSRAERGVCFVMMDRTRPRFGSSSTNGVSRHSVENFFLMLVRLAQSVGQRGESKPYWLRVITRQAFSIADEGEVDPAASLAVGACRVIRRELPESHCKVIDILNVFTLGRHRSELLDQLATEIGLAGNDREVALRGGRRWTSHLTPVSWESQIRGRSLLRKDGVYLITGGFGGLGLELAKHLANNYNARLVLVSRRAAGSGSDASGVRPAAILELKSLTEVLCCPADVSDAESMKSVVDLAERRFGKINGVFHCAGELQDGLLLGKSPLEMERVLRPKVAGTLVLDQLFAQRTLDFMAFYSSVGAWLGLPGQVDYAAANAFLDAVAARSAQIRDYPVLSFAWGAWRDVGMAARLAQGIQIREKLSQHPLLGPRTTQPDGSSEFLMVVDAEDTWILDGHRSQEGDVAFLPGTAYLELGHAAAQATWPGHVTTLEDLVLITPLAVEGPTEIRVRLEEPDREFVVASRPVIDGVQPEWTEHARGRISATLAAVPPRQDISDYRLACTKQREFRPGELPTRQGQMLRFGPRWATLHRACFDDGTAIGELGVPAQFASDLASTPLHPALLDIATGFALPLVRGYDSANSFYVPLSYRKVTIHRGLEASILSLVRCRDPDNTEMAVFDVTLVSRYGDVLVEIEEFVMKRLQDQKLQPKQGRPAGSSPRITSAARLTLRRIVADGITAADGVRVLDCLLRAGCPPQTLVNPYDLDAWSRCLEEASSAQNAKISKSSSGNESALVSQPRPRISTPFVAPACEVEERLASMWKESLGLAEVGLDDNFFELGGHSLELVRLIIKCRKALQADIPVGDPQVLGNPTIRVMARLATTRRASAPLQEMVIKRVSREQYRTSE